MKEQEPYSYSRIAKAIEYIKAHYTSQPSLEQVADYVGLSPFHFQRLFSEWAGISPKKFVQYLSLSHAKSLLREKQASLFETSEALGFSSSSRLHDLFVSIESMTPAEYKNGAKDLQIGYSFAESPFGRVLMASTAKGLCHLAFVEDENQAFASLQGHFPAASFIAQRDALHQQALLFFSKDWSQLPSIKLHLKGSDFQLKVWESLLKIPSGKLKTYGSIAQELGNANASRAVGSAIGSNPIAYLIPCHRVIQSTGHLGGYMWGETRKSAIIAWDSE